MKTKILNGCVVALLLLMSVQRATAGEGNSRAKLRNATGIELLGNSLLYSFYYQRMINPTLGLDAGLAMYGGGSSAGSSFIAFIPVGAKVYVIPKNGSLYLTGGGVWLTSSTDSGPFDDEISTFYGYAGLGFEHRSESGFVFRFAAYSIFIKDVFFVWPGVTLGYAF